MNDGEARFEALVAQVHDPLMRYLRRRTDMHSADEVMSDVLLTLWRRLDSIPEPAPLPWCYGVARRALANHRRSTQRRLRLAKRLESEPAVHGHDDDSDLAQALATLSESEHELVTLWAWEGLEPREIAVVLETTANAVSLRLARVKKKLAAELTRQNHLSGGHNRDGNAGARP